MTDKEIILQMASTMMHGVISSGATLTPEYEDVCIEYAFSTFFKIEEHYNKVVGGANRD